MKSRIHHYRNQQIEVSYDLPRCIHAEACVRRLAAVFDRNQRRWIQPDQAPADEIAETIQHCPTGALHYTRQDGGGDETPPDTNTVRLVEHGPLYVRGNITITSADDTVLLEDTRAALCRCGASDNKPLCDNNHLDINFCAPTVERDLPTSEIMPFTGSKLTVAPTLDGPLHLTGSILILDGNEQIIFCGEETWLCRCGGSANKPFCDGSHKRVGFRAE